VKHHRNNDQVFSPTFVGQLSSILHLGLTYIPDIVIWRRDSNENFSVHSVFIING
jgi:hypothetical protein